ncbi:MAG: hypothetical protein ACR2IV_15095 [Bryobacteraceae bacterium]
METTAVQSWEGAYTGSQRWYIRFFPSLTDLIFLLPAFLILSVLQGTKILLADGDTGWHIRTGEWILQNRTVPTLDLFSFTKPHAAWFSWEWGWDLLFAPVHQIWGLAGVAFANLLVLCLISALLYRLVRRCCENDLLALLFTAVALGGSSIHWLARPHLFSWLFLLLFSHALLSAEEGNRKALWWLPLLMVAWVNIHGAFFIGIFMVLISAIGEAARVFTTNKQISWLLAYRRMQPYLLCTAACVGASFINPYTWRLHRHIFHYLLDFQLLDQIQEYQSVSFHHGPVILFEGMLLLGAFATVWCLQHARFATAILIVLWAHLALVSARNIPIFLFIATPWIACMVRDALRSYRPSGWLGRSRAAVVDIYKELKPIERIGRWHLVSVVAALCMACSIGTGNQKFEAAFDPKNFPAQAIPVLQGMKEAHVFTYDQWGDYLIYRLYPSGRVFVDGRGEFYGADFLVRCQRLIEGAYNWETELKHFGVDTVLLRTDAPLAEVLKKSRNWNLVIDDGSLIIFRAGFKMEHATGAPPQDQLRFSPVFRNGGKKLGASFGLQVDDRDVQSTTHERRSL